MEVELPTASMHVRIYATWYLCVEWRGACRVWKPGRKLNNVREVQTCRQSIWLQTEYRGQIQRDVLLIEITAQTNLVLRWPLFTSTCIALCCTCTWYTLCYYSGSTSHLYAYSYSSELDAKGMAQSPKPVLPSPLATKQIAAMLANKSPNRLLVAVPADDNKWSMNKPFLEAHGPRTTTTMNTLDPPTKFTTSWYKLHLAGTWETPSPTCMANSNCLHQDKALEMQVLNCCSKHSFSPAVYRGLQVGKCKMQLWAKSSLLIVLYNVDLAYHNGFFHLTTNSVLLYPMVCY